VIPAGYRGSGQGTTQPNPPTHVPPSTTQVCPAAQSEQSPAVPTIWPQKLVASFCRSQQLHGEPEAPHEVLAACAHWFWPAQTPGRGSFRHFFFFLRLAASTGMVRPPSAAVSPSASTLTRRRVQAVKRVASIRLLLRSRQ
jgi:hypothetical protein